MIFKNNILGCAINIAGGVFLGLGTIINLFINGFASADIFKNVYDSDHLIAKPLHLAGRLLVTAISGLVFIFLFNKISRYTNLHILLPINWLTVSISGLFGIMGVLILVIWQMLV